ncbi:MAG TPA: hypothetical protein VFB42_12330 [Gaiellaceae bacterium]|nr:hypothetical protein [Gaiellaceae bacterium]
MLVLACILAGCGGSGSANWQRVEGDGFRFEAPAGWAVSGTSAAGEGPDRVEVSVFRLVRPYDPSRRAAAARELDGVAARLARQLHGRVSARSSVRVAGLDGRAYTVDYERRVEEITFLLDGRREYQLLCRRAEGGDDGACRRLVASFELG